jgi:hypothetical protein
MGIPPFPNLNTLGLCFTPSTYTLSPTPCQYSAFELLDTYPMVGVTMAILHQDALIFVFVLARHETRWKWKRRKNFPPVLGLIL